MPENILNVPVFSCTLNFAKDYGNPNGPYVFFGNLGLKDDISII